MSSGSAHMWTEATLSGLISRTSQTRGTKWFAPIPKEEHRNTTIPQPWSSSLALLVKYVWHIKIIVQTEGLTVAQSRPGRCLDHLVGGATARESGMCRGGKETTPGNGTVGNHLHISGHGRFWTAFVPLHFYQWNKLLRVEMSRWYIVIWLESHIRLVCSQALCIIYHSKSLKLVWRVILPPILQMRKQVQGAYASNQVCYISTLALSHHWRQSQITAQNRILNFLPHVILTYFLHTSDIPGIYFWCRPDYCSNVGFQEMVHFTCKHVTGAMVLLPQC